MANYYGTCRTNYFRVTDEEKYQKLFSGLCSEDTVHDFTSVGKDGITRHGFGCFGSMWWTDPDGKTDDGFDSFIDQLQEILPEDEAFIYLESGYEKLRYVVGQYVVATCDEVKWGDINNLAIDVAKELLGDEFKTQLQY